MLCYALGYLMKLTEIHNLMLCTRKLTEIHNVMLCTRLYDEIDSDT